MAYTPSTYWKGVATVVGTTIGVGIFGVPYVLARSGGLIGLFHIVIIGGLLIMLNLLFAEIVLRTRDKLQFVGITRVYLKRFGGYVASVVSIMNFWAALLAYTIIGGSFLHLLFHHLLGWSGEETVYSVIFTVACALVVAAGIQMIAKSEFQITILMAALIVAFGVIATVVGDSGVVFSADFRYALLPYGVVLFALSCVSAVPFLEELVGGEKQLLPRVIIDGGIISILLTVVFAASTLSITATKTSPDTLTGLALAWGAPAIILGSLFGVFAIITSYIVIGDNLMKVFYYDYKIPKTLAWATACFVPLLIYLFGTRNFISVIDAAGSILGGVTGIIIAHIYFAAKHKHTREPEYTVPHGKAWAVGLYGVFVLGVIYQISKLLK